MPVVSLPDRFRVYPELAAAGLWSTPSDIAKYLVSVEQYYAGGSSGPLNSSLAHEMLSRGVGGRGLGLSLNGIGDAARFGHDGDFPPNRSTATWYSLARSRKRSWARVM
jgi:hypothetical protein